MNLPIILVTDLPLWYHWIGNIVAIIVFIGVIIYAITNNHADTEWDAFKITTGLMTVGIFGAVISIAIWGLLVFILPGAIVYLIRLGYWGIKDWYFYRKHDL